MAIIEVDPEEVAREMIRLGHSKETPEQSPEWLNDLTDVLEEKYAIREAVLKAVKEA